MIQRRCRGGGLPNTKWLCTPILVCVNPTTDTDLSQRDGVEGGLTEHKVVASLGEEGVEVAGPRPAHLLQADDALLGHLRLKGETRGGSVDTVRH
jgi:hypothetical protein